ncbi:MAG: hypothetical protein ACRDR6_07020 [Pseudonocardiaceae bacterium]
MTGWALHAARLADELTKSGKLWSPPWQAAVRAIPRHELVPVHYQRKSGPDQWISTDTATDLDLVYSNTALFVLPDGLSSTSMPALMTRMPPWVEQTRDAGLILADVTPAQLAGNLVLLHRTSDGAEGRFDRTYGSFMAMRRVGETYTSPRPSPTRDRAGARSRGSTLDVTRPWEHPVPWFLAHFQPPAGITFGLCGEDTSKPPTTTFLAAADGSWCEIDEHRRVWECGSHQLWRIIEDAHSAWCAMGQPGWERFGLTVRPSQQWVWLDSPDSDIRWDLG